MAPLQEKVVFGMFFLDTVLCLSLSWFFHTVYCYSEKVSGTFFKLDYSGIALLIMGSFVPWLYDSFYCSPQPRSSTFPLSLSWAFLPSWHSGISLPLLSTGRQEQECSWDLAWVGLCHYALYYRSGLCQSHTVGQMGWFFLMAVMYITGAWPLCCSDFWVLLSWKIWHMVPVSSDIPCPGGGSSFCLLLWGLQPSGIVMA
jgi:adiponectin receptor